MSRAVYICAYAGNPHDDPIWEEVAEELASAQSKFDPMHGPHEGWAVIREELDELWEHVRDNTGRSRAARHEAIQIAAMALRYANDVAP